MCFWNGIANLEGNAGENEGEMEMERSQRAMSMRLLTCRALRAVWVYAYVA